MVNLLEIEYSLLIYNLPNTVIHTHTHIYIYIYIIYFSFKPSKLQIWISNYNFFKPNLYKLEYEFLNSLSLQIKL